MLASFLRYHSRGAYARDKNTSARLRAKNAGGGLCARGGGVSAGHYGIYEKYIHIHIYLSTLLSPCWLWGGLFKLSSIVNESMQ